MGRADLALIAGRWPSSSTRGWAPRRRSPPWRRPCAASCRPRRDRLAPRARHDRLPGRPGAALARRPSARGVRSAAIPAAARLAPLPARARGRRGWGCSRRVFGEGPATRGADDRRRLPGAVPRRGRALLRTSPARWRRSRARSRSTGASPASSSTACRSASTSSTATTGSRAGIASGRPAPRASGGTRWSAGRSSTCSRGSRRRSSAPSSTGCSRPARSSRSEQEVSLGGETQASSD